MMPDVDRHEMTPNCREYGLNSIPGRDILRPEGLAYCRKTNRPQGIVSANWRVTQSRPARRPRWLGDSNAKSKPASASQGRSAAGAQHSGGACWRRNRRRGCAYGTDTMEWTAFAPRSLCTGTSASIDMSREN